MVLIVDEMKVREDLIYDKTGETLHGFTNLGDVNNQLRELEKQANSGKQYDSFATQMLTLMVRGVFIKLEFPYASFPTKGSFLLTFNGIKVCSCLYTVYAIHLGMLCHQLFYTMFICFYIGVTGEMLYWIMWEAVRRLEEINLKVIFELVITFLYIVCSRHTTHYRV